MKGLVKNGYNVWYREWANRPENMLLGSPVLSMVRDGEQVEILDFHWLNGEKFCSIRAAGLGGSIHSHWLEILPEDAL